MQVEFRRIAPTPSSFEVMGEGVVLSGSFQKRPDGLVDLQAHLKGPLALACDRCGEAYEVSLDEELELVASDGVYESEVDEEEDEGVIEFLDGKLDLNEVSRGEVELIRGDYHVCPKCTDIEEGEDDGSP